MARTAEQRQADDALTAAIDAVSRAYYGEPEGVLVTFMVITSWIKYDDEGDTVEANELLYRDGTMPTTQAMGLARWADARLAADTAAD